MQYTTIDRVLSKLNRDLKGIEIQKDDVIEWIGDALEQLQVNDVLEEVVTFLTVKDYRATLPLYLKYILQIARNRCFDSDNVQVSYRRFMENLSTGDTSISSVYFDDTGQRIDPDSIYEYRSYVSIKSTYDQWTISKYFQECWTPVRSTKHSYFKAIVCQEKNSKIYKGNEDVYKITGTVSTANSDILFSFKDGQVAVSYLRNAIDEETGYPLIPDTGSHIEAITYYVKWKIMEWWSFSNARKETITLAQDNERKWLKYVKQANNTAKMPKTLDDYQRLLEQSHTFLPDINKYNKYFGNLYIRH